MRKARLIHEEGECFYHCMSRVVDKRFIFNEIEKNTFRRMMRKLEAFLGVEVVTYCLMSNHFHLLVRVPDRETLPPLTEESLLEKLPILYKGIVVRDVRQELERARNSGDARWTREILQRYEGRRGDLSVFMKELKQRFTQWYNRRQGRRGTLWEDRFKSVLVEGSENALLTMATYIDLNPVRAGLVEDPKDYSWCGYAEAVAGDQRARRGLGTILEQSPANENHRVTWRETAPKYRLLLFGNAGEVKADPEFGTKGRRGLSEERIEEEFERGGQLSVAEVLRCRVRYFCDGAIFGSVAFVDGIFEANRSRYGPRRKSGARKMQGADWGDLRVLRDLRVDVIEAPG